MTAQTVVVVVREPDYANEIRVFGGDATVIDVDCGRMDLTNQDEFLDWAEDQYAKIDSLPEGHPGRGVIEAVVLRYAETHGFIDRADIERHLSADVNGGAS